MRTVHQEFRLMGASSLTLIGAFVESFLFQKAKYFHKLIHRGVFDSAIWVGAIRRKALGRLSGAPLAAI